MLSPHIAVKNFERRITFYRGKIFSGSIERETKWKKLKKSLKWTPPGNIKADINARDINSERFTTPLRHSTTELSRGEAGRAEPEPADRREIFVSLVGARWWRLALGEAHRGRRARRPCR